MTTTVPPFAFLFSLLTVVLPLFGQSEDAAQLDPSLSIVRGMVERFSGDRGSVERFYNLSFSESRIDRFRAFYREYRQQLNGVDFEKLAHSDRIDYLLFKNRLESELARLTQEEERLREVDGLLPFRPAIVEQIEARQRVEPIKPSEIAKTLTQIAQQVADAREQLEGKLVAGDDDGEPPYKQTVANRAARVIDQIQKALEEWNQFYVGYHPEFTWWVKKPYEDLDQELAEYAAFLREKLVGTNDDEEEPVVGDPIGREALLDALRYEMIPYTPEELIEIANQEFAWCEREYKKAARELGFGDEWRKAMNHVKDLYVQPGDQPQLIKSLANEAVAFLEKHDLVTIPKLCKETWRMRMMTPERQRVNPYFTGGETISVSFPTDTMAYEDRLMSLRGNNIHFSRATVHHELIPGHHLQGFMAKRYRAHRRVFRTPFLVEGWALYWEMLLWDMGFPKTAEDRVGFLFWRSHRCARIIFSLRFHLGELSADEAIEFLIERVGHERRNATAEVRRSVQGDYGPLYQAAYMLGGLQIRAMHKELVDSGKMTDRQFHDAILRENAIPVALIRASLTKQPLGKDFKSEWRFYELPKNSGSR